MDSVQHRQGGCPADCPGRRSPWHPVRLLWHTTQAGRCPLGRAQCSGWNSLEPSVWAAGPDSAVLPLGGARDE